MVFLYIRDEGNVRRMDTAVKINKLVKEKSSNSKMILINLPTPPKVNRYEHICILFNAACWLHIIRLVHASRL